MPEQGRNSFEFWIGVLWLWNLGWLLVWTCLAWRQARRSRPMLAWKQPRWRCCPRVSGRVLLALALSTLTLIVADIVHTRFEWPWIDPYWPNSSNDLDSTLIRIPFAVALPWATIRYLRGGLGHPPRTWNGQERRSGRERRRAT